MVSSFAKQSSMLWSHMLIGNFLVIIVNSLVVIGILFNIYFLLIPWQLVYILGEFFYSALIIRSIQNYICVTLYYITSP